MSHRWQLSSITWGPTPDLLSQNLCFNKLPGGFVHTALACFSPYCASSLRPFLQVQALKTVSSEVSDSSAAVAEMLFSSWSCSSVFQLGLRLGVKPVCCSGYRELGLWGPTARVQIHDCYFQNGKPCTTIPLSVKWDDGAIGKSVL